MGKLKEKLLNNLPEEQMEDVFGISAFEYVELMSKYKDDESYVPTEAEVEDIEKLVEEYYQSKEFQDYLDTDIESVLSYEEWHRNRDAMAEQFKIDEINDSLILKYTDNDILYMLDGIAGPTLKNMIIHKLNDIWNTKRGLF
jgi:hypothetical protein